MRHRPNLRVLPLALGAVLLVAGAAACSEEFDRDEAARRLAQDRGWTEKEAGCWVDRVVDELGEDAIDRPEPSVPEPLDVAATVDCVAPDRLLTDGATSTSAPTVPAGEPDRYGDDAELDALWDACAGGDGPACDTLFEEAPLGSEYERFGNSCGDRGFRPRCADEPGSG